MKPKPFHLAGLLAVLLPILTVCQSRAELPPEAQEAMKKGIIAAKEQDYLLATRYFQDARKVVPDSPEIYYSLGLAESKIPGRELRAIAWFGAYLAATTNAPNATAIKDQIDALDVKSQSNLSHLIQSSQDACGKMPDGRTKNYNLVDIAGLWAGVGDLTAALKAANLISDSNQKDQALGQIIEAQVMTGDIAGALKTTNLIGAYGGDYARGVIAPAQAEAGDFTGAQRTAESIGDGKQKSVAMFLIGCDQAKAGDFVGAQSTAGLIQDADHKNLVLTSIIQGQARAGDFAGAQKTARSSCSKSANRNRKAASIH